MKWSYKTVTFAKVNSGIELSYCDYLDVLSKHKSCLCLLLPLSIPGQVITAPVLLHTLGKVLKAAEL